MRIFHLHIYILQNEDWFQFNDSNETSEWRKNIDENELQLNHKGLEMDIWKVRISLNSQNNYSDLWNIDFTHLFIIAKPNENMAAKPNEG